MNSGHWLYKQYKPAVNWKQKDPYHDHLHRDAWHQLPIVWCQWNHPHSRDQVMDNNSHISSCCCAKLLTASQTTLHLDWAETKTQEERWMWRHHWAAWQSSQSVVNPPTSYTHSLSAPDTPQTATEHLYHQHHSASNQSWRHLLSFNVGWLNMCLVQCACVSHTRNKFS